MMRKSVNSKVINVVWWPSEIPAVRAGRQLDSIVLGTCQKVAGGKGGGNRGRVTTFWDCRKGRGHAKWAIKRGRVMQICVRDHEVQYWTGSLCFASISSHFQSLLLSCIKRFTVACENIHFSSLFAAGDVLLGGTSVTQRQKLHTDDANQCLHYKSSSHEVPNINLTNFTCLLVDFGGVLCSSATSSSKTQMLL